VRYIVGALWALLLLAIVSFSIQNRAAVEVSFLVWSMSMPKVFLILGTFFLGMLAGWGVVRLARSTG
jgi:uncharacterized integral membrane protein